MALLIRIQRAYHLSNCVRLDDHRTEKGITRMAKTTRAARRQAHQRQRRIRSVIFVFIVVGVVGLAGYYLYSAFFRSAPLPMAGNVIDVAADMGGFDKPEIKVKAGESVTIRPALQFRRAAQQISMLPGAGVRKSHSGSKIGARTA